MGRDAEQQIDHPRQIREGGKSMKDIILPALMVFLSGAAFGIGTTLAIDWYYRRQEDKDDGK